MNNTKHCLEHSRLYFPSDILDDNTLVHGGVVLHIFLFVYAAIALCILTESYLLGALHTLSRMCRLSNARTNSGVLAFGFSLPALIISCFSTFLAPSDVGTSSVIGTSAFNMFVVVPLVASLTSKKLTLHWYPMSRDIIFVMMSLIVLIIATSNAELVTLITPCLLIALYIGYILFLCFDNRIRTQCQSCCGRDDESNDEIKPLLNSKIISFNLEGCDRPRQKRCTNKCKKNKSCLKPILKINKNKEKLSLEQKNGLKNSNSGQVVSESSAPLDKEENVIPTKMHLDSNNDVKHLLASQQEHKVTIQEADCTALDESETDTDRGYYSDQMQLQSEQLMVDGSLSDMSLRDYRSRRKVTYRKITATTKGPFYVTPDLECYSIGVKSQFNPPETFIAKFAWATILPILILFYFTIPDCRIPKRRLLYLWTLFICIAWICGLCFLMLWMVTVISYVFGIPESFVGMTVLTVALGVPGINTALALCQNKKTAFLQAKSFGSTILNISLMTGLPWLLQVARNKTVYIEDFSLFNISVALFILTLIACAILRASKWNLTSRIITVVGLLYCITILSAIVMEFSPLTKSRIALC